MPTFMYVDNGTEHWFTAPDIDSAKRDAMRDDVREFTDDEIAAIEAEAIAAMEAEAAAEAPADGASVHDGTDDQSVPEAGTAGESGGLTPVGDPAVRLDTLLGSGDQPPTFPPGVVGTDPDA